MSIIKTTVYVLNRLGTDSDNPTFGVYNNLGDAEHYLNNQQQGRVKTLHHIVANATIHLVDQWVKIQNPSLLGDPHTPLLIGGNPEPLPHSDLASRTLTLFQF